ncbi:MAG: TldD/PmbA family protein [Paracoccaceae bacterium]
MNNNLEVIASALLDMSKKAGAEAAEVIGLEKKSLNVDVLNGMLEGVERSEAIDIGLRVIVEGRQACLSCSDVREESLEKMVTRSLSMAREAPVDKDIVLATNDQLVSAQDLEALDLIDTEVMVEADRLEKWAIEAEVEARKVKGITQVQGSSASVGIIKSQLAFSNGFSQGYSRSGVNISCVSISGQGNKMERDYASESRVHISDLPSPSSIGQLSGERAAARFGARKPPTGNYPVLYDERVSSSLVGHLIGAINGASIVRGSSWLAKNLGEEIFPKNISIKECPLKVRCSGSRPFDAEGLKTNTKNIINNGILETWLLDLSSSQNLGLESTGNAVRSVSSPPSPGISNISLIGGLKSRDYLIKEMGTGLLVTSMIGLTLNPITGDYSRGASGYWVENGEVKYPVNECTLAGNLKEMLKTIIPANDSKRHLSFSVPSLLVQGLKIAGK